MVIFRGLRTSFEVPEAHFTAHRQGVCQWLLPRSSQGRLRTPACAHSGCAMWRTLAGPSAMRPAVSSVTDAVRARFFTKDFASKTRSSDFSSLRMRDGNRASLATRFLSPKGPSLLSFIGYRQPVHASGRHGPNLPIRSLKCVLFQGLQATFANADSSNTW